MRTPSIDYGSCNGCGACIEVCPAVFSMNDMGFVEVSDLDSYPEKEVDESIAVCPEDAIVWEDS